MRLVTFLGGVGFSVCVQFLYYKFILLSYMEIWPNNYFLGNSNETKHLHRKSRLLKCKKWPDSHDG